MNPWGLSPAEERAMDAMVKTGSQKGAARALGVSVKAIEVHCQAARDRMFQEGRFLHLLLWDRWRQKQSAAMNDERCAA